MHAQQIVDRPAEAAHAISAAPAFGVHGGAVCVDGKAVMARVRAEHDRFVDFILSGINKIAADDRLRGYARFVNARQLQVDEHTIVNAERIVIATGSSPQIPVELHELGERVALFGRSDRLAQLSDPAVRDVAAYRIARRPARRQWRVAAFA